MRPTLRAVLFPLLITGAATGCGLTGSRSYPTTAPARPATDLPARFEPADPALRLAPADTLAGGGCLSPMLDPRDGTELRLQRSGTERGDYAVPGSRYGVGPRELLQLTCNTGAPLGIVDR